MTDAQSGNSAYGTRFIVYTALLVALGILIPMVFHQFGIGGKVFLPMHFPVIIGGLLFGPWCGFLVGLLSPVLSFLLTGMPPLAPPILLVMIPELITYGILSGWLRSKFRAPILLVLFGAMVGGRVVAGLAVWGLIHILDFHVKPWVFVWGAIVTGLPGIVGQIVLIPLLVQRLKPQLVEAE